MAGDEGDVFACGGEEELCGKFIVRNGKGVAVHRQAPEVIFIIQMEAGGESVFLEEAAERQGG